MSDRASHVEQDYRCRGEHVTIYSAARVLARENIALGSNIIIDDFVFIGRQRELIVGNHVHIASFASITGGGRLVIGDFSGIASGARILTGSDDFQGSGLTGPTIPPEFRAVERSEVVVESHAIVGANAVVLPGVRIGEGAVVGAGAIVTRDLPSWTINVGSPARPIKTRPSETILRMEEALYEKYGRPIWSARIPCERSAAIQFVAHSIAHSVHPADDARAA